MTRSILITGCSSGIGLDAARTMRERGWRVIATARKPEDLARLKNFLGVEALPLELSDPQSIATCAVQALEMTRGKIDALFNNAAFAQAGAIEDLSPKLLREQFEVNVIGTHDLTRRLIPSMRKNGEGRIVNCSSVLGLVVAPYRGAYCASKFALEALSASLRLELEGSGISVSLIEPGPIRSRFVESALARLLATIDIENSPHRDVYQRRIEAMKAGGKVTFKLEPAAVSKRLVHAVESTRPRRHYYVTTPTYLAVAMRRVLPQFGIDYFTRNS
ncbi:SDR family NAD(P)-dependent oxidoreductase [Pseudorhodoplanes sp.]|uniref:SDR family NAD(P)-dependent oxidoreductase n=1 Tax=Pseudorhodoplanes sp. TaxID=1934341 RepID=UPI002C0CA789|nr:SDR family NAD(P)-dependent oxidoreductase [Pseudorhodoplanes sp.]HWV42820.1 SDR family NAD(P)-dependent oxidoreductase [Pseudorhodoplanes sp.]